MNPEDLAERVAGNDAEHTAELEAFRDAAMAYERAHQLTNYARSVIMGNQVPAPPDGETNAFYPDYDPKNDIIVDPKKIAKRLTELDADEITERLSPVGDKTGKLARFGYGKIEGYRLVVDEEYSRPFQASIPDSSGTPRTVYSRVYVKQTLRQGNDQSEKDVAKNGPKGDGMPLETAIIFYTDPFNPDSEIGRDSILFPDPIDQVAIDHEHAEALTHVPSPETIAKDQERLALQIGIDHRQQIIDQTAAFEQSANEILAFSTVV